MGSLYLTWQFRTTQIYRRRGGTYISSCGSFWKCSQWTLTKITFCLASVYLHLLSGYNVGKISSKRSYMCIFFFFQINCLNLITSIKAISKAKGSHAGHMSPGAPNEAHPHSAPSVECPHRERRCSKCAEFSYSHLNGPGSIFRTTITPALQAWSWHHQTGTHAQRDPRAGLTPCCCLLEILGGAP